MKAYFLFTIATQALVYLPTAKKPHSLLILLIINDLYELFTGSHDQQHRYI